MKKFSKEQEEYFRMCIEEAERDIEENGTITWDELWQKIEEDERREGIYTKRRITQNYNMKLSLAKCFGKISRRFVKAL